MSRQEDALELPQHCGGLCAHQHGKVILLPWVLAGNTEGDMGEDGRTASSKEWEGEQAPNSSEQSEQSWRVAGAFPSLGISSGTEE